MDKDLERLISGHRDAVTVRRIFGDPFEKNGVTVIPAAKVMGGGGGGAGKSPSDDSEGSGTGFGLTGHPVGAYVIKGDQVRWTPAIDVNRIITGAFALAVLALLVKMRR